MLTLAYEGDFSDEEVVNALGDILDGYKLL